MALNYLAGSEEFEPGLKEPETLVLLRQHEPSKQKKERSNEAALWAQNALKKAITSLPELRMLREP